MKFSEAIRELSASDVENAKYDAKRIFMHFGGFSQSDFLFGDPESENSALIEAIERRSAREPLQYIIGEVCFFKESYEVSPSCLIPRSDTEILVEYAIAHIPKDGAFLDLCTGSGCIAISTLANTVGTTATALDISGDALNVALKNAEKNCVKDRIKFIEKDVTKEAHPGIYDAILSNPPYVTENDYENLSPEIYHEPKIAFVGGYDGLDFYKAIIEIYKNSLKPEGFFAFEIGYDQADSLCDIASRHSMSAEILYDYSSNPRVAVLKKLK